MLKSQAGNSCRFHRSRVWKRRRERLPREVFGIFQVVDPGRQVSADQQPVLADKQAETILLTPEHLLDDGIGIEVFRTIVHYVSHMFGKSSILRNFYRNKDNLFGANQHPISFTVIRDEI